ncbi:MAG: hypothetical protein ACP5P1_15485 [Acidimicrobiales bacterium]
MSGHGGDASLDIESDEALGQIGEGVAGRVKEIESRPVSYLFTPSAPKTRTSL